MTVYLRAELMADLMVLMLVETMESLKVVM